MPDTDPEATTAPEAVTQPAEGRDDGGGEEPGTTAVAPSRWTGAAPVPAGDGRKRRGWLRRRGSGQPPAVPAPRPALPPTLISPTMAGGPPEPIRRDPTLAMPGGERDAIAAGIPVDPWADADPLLISDYRMADRVIDLPPPTRAPSPPPPPQSPPPAMPPAHPGRAGLPPTRAWKHPAGPAPAPSQRSAPQPAQRSAPQPGSALQPRSAPQPRRALPPTRAWRRSSQPAPPALPAPRPAGPPAGPPGPMPGNRSRPPLVPPGYEVVQPRRRRRFPVKTLMFLTLTLGCCCGLPWYVAKPIWEQYPAAAALPDKIADLRLRDADSATTRGLEFDMRASHLVAEDTFAGVYGDGNGKRVTVFGATGFRLSPDKDLVTEVGRLTDKYKLKDLRDVDSGVRGLYERCGVGRFDGATVAVCTWADHGSVGTAMFTRRSVDESATLLQRFRTAILTVG